MGAGAVSEFFATLKHGGMRHLASGDGSTQIKTAVIMDQIHRVRFLRDTRPGRAPHGRTGETEGRPLIRFDASSMVQVAVTAGV